MTDAPRAVVLLSGGMDSATILAMAKAGGFDVCAMTIRYGQRHEVEVEAAQAVAAAQGVEKHIIVHMDLDVFGGSALTTDTPVPKDRSDDEIGSGIPITYVPARNTVFLSYALAWAETLDASAIFIGVNALDYSGYPDCRPQFIAAFEAMANLATRAGVDGTVRTTVQAPLIDLTKAEIVEKGLALGVDFGLTLSCYDPVTEGGAPLHCGHCDACLLRKKGFAEAEAADPTRYVD